MRSITYLAGLSVVLTMGLCGAAEGATIYGASFMTDSLYKFDTDTGLVETVGALGVDFYEGGLAMTPGGELYGAFAGPLDELYSINTTTGAATSRGAFNFGIESDVSAIAFNSSGELYGVDSDNERLVTINPLTGAGTVFGDGDTGITNIGSVVGLAFDGADSLWMAESESNSLYEFSGIGGGDDTATLIENLGLDRPAGMTFAIDDGEVKLYVVQSGVTTELYTLDLTTRALVPVPMVDTLPLGIGGMAGIVPEPNTLALLGLGGLAVLRRRIR
ncbi:MAG: PEP-CTERM sorting domain-containing protein [bacterium]|nr:PEP-CTERM sorting domain-containing protein [bacterium]